MRSSSLSCSGLTAWVIAAVVLQILGLSLFILGFFPVKSTLSGVSGPESYQKPNCSNADGSYDLRGGGERDLLPPEELRELYKELSGIPPAFDRLIIMVIDGLPAEFVLGSDRLPPSKQMMESMPYTQALLSSGSATAFHAKAAPPTVTMPRLKAIVSGAIGGFLDVALNFNTQAFHDDNILAQFSYIGWQMIMLGDETWIKLFPGLFTRQDGVTSFFVKDTVEVDLNVSRHLKYELFAEDWNLLILHYLGLDHVGHIGGRHCHLMPSKLKEMDDVIKTIHTSAILDESNGSMRTLLMVISDHGMTEGGNHGGSSFEETDTIALFVGLDGCTSKVPPLSFNKISQVSIAPTLALLFGVPIPKNSVGIVLLDILNSLTDEQKLRALELNSWQLINLLRAELPNLSCETMFSDSYAENSSQLGKFTGKTAKGLHQLFLKAVNSHRTWNHLNDLGTMCNVTDHFIEAVAAYTEFLRTASELLSQRASHKPLGLLAAGVGAMIASSFLLFYILLRLFKEVKLAQRRSLDVVEIKKNCCGFNIDEYFIMIGIFLHLFSLGASSMVEEEQYTWHFLASTLYLILLYINLQVFSEGEKPNNSYNMEGKTISRNPFENGVGYDAGLAETQPTQWKRHKLYQICCILIVLICGRILRGWHQGGINWTYLPDISKWLERSGSSYIEAFQIASLLFIIILSSFSLVRSWRIFTAILTSFMSGFLIVLHVTKYMFPTMAAFSYLGNSLLRAICVILLLIVIVVLVSPWFVSLSYTNITEVQLDLKSSVDLQTEILGTRDSAYLIGGVFTSSWCLLQLLLQHQLNAIPLSLLLLQIHASVAYFRTDRTDRKLWIEVAAMYFLGMAGHFGLGNSNSIATVDVAGAFTGHSSRSMVIAGILMFVITHASSLLFSFGMIMSPPDPESSELSYNLAITIGFRCLVPLVLNSMALTSFTIILLIMRNHLFVWSVFSPKYLYICAATLSVYIGVSVIAATYLYLHWVLSCRIKWWVKDEIS